MSRPRCAAPVNSRRQRITTWRPTKLDQVETKAKKKVHAAGKDFARHLHDFEKTNAKHVARAKREIKADVAKIKKATAGLGDKLRAHKK